MTAPALPVPPSTNNGSLVIRLVYEEVAFLLTADIEAVAELALGMGAVELEATVLKIAHHGSDTSTTTFFLRHVRPALAVISVGVNNPFAIHAPTYWNGWPVSQPSAPISTAPSAALGRQDVVVPHRLLSASPTRRRDRWR